MASAGAQLAHSRPPSSFGKPIGVGVGQESFAK
jgi:hypothetical protein